MIKKIQTLIVNNWQWKLMSVAAAFVIWLAVANVNDPVQEKLIRDVPVEITYADAITGMGKAYTVTKNSTIDIYVSAKTTQINSITRDDFYASVNMKYHYGVDENEQAAKIDIEIVNNKDKIQSYRVSGSDVMYFTLEDIISKEFPIEVITTGSLEEGFALDGELVTDPATVTVTAPESEFSSINKAAVTVDLGDFTADNTEVDGVIVLYDSAGGIMDDNTDISLDTLTVSVYAGVLRTKSVTVSVQGTTGTPASGYRYGGAECNPDTITVAGLKADTANLTSIVIPADALDITGADADRIFEIDLEQYLPENVQLVGEESTITVTVAIEKLHTENYRILASKIALVGADSSMTYTVGENCTLTLMGLKDDLDAFSVDSASPSVNVTGLQAGEYDLVVSVNLSSGYQMMQTPTVHVIVSENAKESAAESSTAESSTEESTSAAESTSSGESTEE